MMHKHRRWSVAKVETAEELADKLSNYSWCVCSGFEFEGYLWLNDSTGPDNAQEWAAVRLPNESEPHFRQVESITVSWCSQSEVLDYIKSVQGTFPPPLLASGSVVVCRTQHEFAAALGSKKRPEGAIVHPTIETPEEHGRCPHCA